MDIEHALSGEERRPLDMPSSYERGVLRAVDAVCPRREKEATAA